MKGKIMLNLAISLDGYISDEDGGYAWIGGQGDDGADTEMDHPFDAFLEGIDVIVMGGASYRQGFAADHPSKDIYVATHRPGEDAGNIRFIGGDIVSPVLSARDAGRHVYLFGGGISIDPFLKADVIDEFFIGIIPVILGKGRPLFLENNPTIPLRLMSHSVRDGVAVLHYMRRA